MCGIIGLFNYSGSDINQKVERALETQKHRGPDFQDYKVLKSGSAIGHNRLSIVDISTDSNQPMLSNSGRFALVFNGEVYNYLELRAELSSGYSFKTKGDTEVILAAWEKWGPLCLERFNGMFSFIIVDMQIFSVYLCRDRFGVKPMFYYQAPNGAIYIASEIKTLWSMGVPKEMNQSVLADYFKTGSYGMPEESFWSGVQQLPGGHIASFKIDDSQGSSFKVERWYNFVNRVENIERPQGDAEIEEQYLELLRDAVKLRFRSDVPVGFNISGGLDSSALLALVHELFPDNRDIQAFTFYNADSRYDELPWVEKMIKRTSKPLNKVLLDVKALPGLIQNVSDFQDEPFGGFPTLAYSNIFKVARSKGTTVLLDGQGVDETLAGYDYYRSDSQNLVQGVKTPPTRFSCISGDLQSKSKDIKYPSPFGDALQNKQYRDLFYTKIPRALRFNDRVSMMYSTELREPFLDYRLVEFGFSLNQKHKIKGDQGKWLLRQLMNQKLGNDVALAPKRPLQTPQREWLADDLRDYMEEQVEQFKKYSFTEAKEVDKVWRKYKAGENDNSFYLWQWININTLLAK
jgi:asparagine synthase (glutamine-hydrolysing)